MNIQQEFAKTQLENPLKLFDLNIGQIVAQPQFFVVELPNFFEILHYLPYSLFYLKCCPKKLFFLTPSKTKFP